MQVVRELGSILGIWAHPDDETYLSGGLMAAAVDHGQRVACVTATRGRRGTEGLDRGSPERLAELRGRELAAALELLGVHQQVAALRAQASQTEPLIETFGRDRWREWVRTETFASAAGGHHA